MKSIRHIFLLTLLLAAILAPGVARGAAGTLKVSLDSAYVLMGKATPMHIELVGDESPAGQLLVPADSMADKVEILRVLPADTVALGNGRREIRQEILLQSFDSGTYVLNPVLYVTGHDTLRSNRLALKVIPAMVDSLTTIHDYADVADVDRRLVDYLPDFLVDYGLWILAVIVVGGIAWFVVRRLLRKDKGEAGPKVKPVPPYEQAVRDLNALNAEHLCEHGHEKEFYTRLTDILRVYLQGRFGINAMEMTSTQIRHTLQGNEETRMSRQNMDRVLETADFVKFAKVRPLPDDNTRAFASAMQFVEDTKPKPEPEPQSGEETKTTEK